MRISDWSSDVCSSDLGCLKGVATVRLQDISASTRTGSTKSSSQIVGFSREHRRSALQRFASDPSGDRELAMPGTRWPVGSRPNQHGCSCEQSSSPTPGMRDNTTRSHVFPGSQCNCSCQFSLLVILGKNGNTH